MPRTKKTRNPFGSVFKRTIIWYGTKRTVYDARKRYKNPLGEPKEKFRRCNTYAEAMAALTNFQQEIEKELTEPTRVEHTFFELTDFFDREYVKPAVFIDGVRMFGYRQNLKKVRALLEQHKQFFGDVPLSSITYEDLRRYRTSIATTITRRGGPPSLATINEKLSLLRRILNIAIQNDWLKSSPFSRGSNLIKRSAETRRNRMLTYEEEIMLLDACTGRRAHMRPWIIAALDTAMRRGELYDLKWKDVDLEQRVIYIERGKSDAPRSKTGVPGILPITPRLHDELIGLRTDDDKPDDLVLGRFDFKRAFTSLCKIAGIEDLQFRDLRSTAATRMLLAGNANALVRKVTRHANDEMLISHYTNVDAENARLIGEKLAEFNEFQWSKARSKGNG
jgi:integrase